MLPHFQNLKLTNNHRATNGILLTIIKNNSYKT